MDIVNLIGVGLVIFGLGCMLVGAIFFALMVYFGEKELKEKIPGYPCEFPYCESWDKKEKKK